MNEAKTSYDSEYLQLFTQKKELFLNQYLEDRICMYSYVDKDGFIPQSRLLSRTSAPFTTFNPLARIKFNL